MVTTTQTHNQERFEMNSSEYQGLLKKIREEKADFNALLEAILADPTFTLQATKDIIEAYFKKWAPEFASLGLPE